jgi:hypothetical protein
MNWIKLSVATTLAAALIASPATAYADPEPPPLPAGCAPDSADPACQPPPPPPPHRYLCGLIKGTPIYCG